MSWECAGAIGEMIGQQECLGKYFVCANIHMHPSRVYNCIKVVTVTHFKFCWCKYFSLIVVFARKNMNLVISRATPSQLFCCAWTLLLTEYGWNIYFTVYTVHLQMHNAHLYLFYMEKSWLCSLGALAYYTYYCPYSYCFIKQDYPICFGHRYFQSYTINHVHSWHSGFWEKSKWMEGQHFPDTWKLQQSIIFGRKLKPICTSENWD